MVARQITEDEYLKIRQRLSYKAKLATDIAWYTGERMGAIVQLRISDCYLPNGSPRDYIRFRRETRKGKDRSRTVALNRSLIKILRNYKPYDSEWLLPGRDPDRHITFDAIADALEQACDYLGLTGVSTHSYRRSLINRLARRGYSAKLIQKAVGHANLQSTACYLEACEDEINKALRSL
jgi:integrase/recombinase XerD